MSPPCAAAAHRMYVGCCCYTLARTITMCRLHTALGQLLPHVHGCIHHPHCCPHHPHWLVMPLRTKADPKTHYLHPCHFMVSGRDVDLEAWYAFLSWIAQSHFLGSNVRLRYSAQKCEPSFQVHISSQNHDLCDTKSALATLSSGIFRCAQLQCLL